MMQRRWFARIGGDVGGGRGNEDEDEEEEGSWRLRVLAALGGEEATASVGQWRAPSQIRGHGTDT
jgi:hypothetical protein